MNQSTRKPRATPMIFEYGEKFGNYKIIAPFVGKSADRVNVECGCGRQVRKIYSQLIKSPNAGCMYCRQNKKKDDGLLPGEHKTSINAKKPRPKANIKSWEWLRGYCKKLNS